MFGNRQIAAIEGKCRQFRYSFECLKTHCAANNFSKIFCRTWMVGCQEFGQYIRILWAERFILIESVYGIHGGSFNSYKKDSININGKHEETADRSILFCGLILTVLLGHFWILLVTIVVLLVSYINYFTSSKNLFVQVYKVCFYKFWAITNVKYWLSADTL